MGDLDARRRIQSDFDRLALWGPARWDRNLHYHPWVLMQMPAGAERILEIGCGHGVLTCALAQRARQVVAVDLSGNMLEAAAEFCRGMKNVSFVQADFMEMRWPAEYFDGVVSIATLHHLSLATAAQRIAQTLKPGGRVAIVDLYRPQTFTDWVLAGCGWVCGAAIQRAKTGRWDSESKVRELWRSHSEHDVLDDFCNIQKTYSSSFPNVWIRRGLLFRYLLRWSRGL